VPPKTRSQTNARVVYTLSNTYVTSELEKSCNWMELGLDLGVGTGGWNVGRDRKRGQGPGQGQIRF